MKFTLLKITEPQEDLVTIPKDIYYFIPTGRVDEFISEFSQQPKVETIIESIDEIQVEWLVRQGDFILNKDPRRDDERCDDPSVIVSHDITEGGFP